MPPPEDIDDCEFDTKDTGQFEEEKKDVTWWTYGGEGSGGGGWSVRKVRIILFLTFRTLKFCLPKYAKCVIFCFKIVVQIR